MDNSLISKTCKYALEIPFTQKYRGGSRGRVQGVRNPPQMTTGTTGILQKKKKKTMWLCGLLVLK